MKWRSIEEEPKLNQLLYLCDRNGFIHKGCLIEKSTGIPGKIGKYWQIFQDTSFGNIEHWEIFVSYDICRFNWVLVEEMPLPNQPERSKREDLDCCKKLKKLEYLRQIIIDENIDCGEWHNDYADIVEIFNELIQESKMRCSEHCGNTVRDK